MNFQLNFVLKLIGDLNDTLLLCLSKFFDLNMLTNKILFNLTSQIETDQETIEEFRELTEYLNSVLSNKDDDLKCQ